MSQIVTKPKYISNIYNCKVIDITHLTDTTFQITFERPDFKFTSGQHIIISLDGDLHDREYSICSSEEDLNMKILVKEVNGGYFTPLLKLVKKGDYLKIRGPHGRFCIDYENSLNKEIILIATGTGIAPFRSMFFSYPKLNFKIIHGIRYSNESYYRGEFKSKYLSCTSREAGGDFKGRVTDYIKSIKFPDNSIFYLCGNFDMIYEVNNLLTSKGHNINSIFTEAYF